MLKTNNFLMLFILIITASAQADTVGKPGGVTHSPTRNQVAGQICWSYTLSGLAESEYLKLTGKKIHLSPEYSGFYHFYIQLKNRLPYFRKLAAGIKADPTTRNHVIEEAAAQFTLDVGSTGATALKEVIFAGLVPSNIYFDRIMEDDVEAKLETALKDFVTQNMFESDKLDGYAITDDFGMSKSLYGDLSATLKPILHIIPMLPTDSFNFIGKSYTPRTFMKDYLRFDSTKFQAYVATAKTHDLAIAAVTNALSQNYVVPLGIDLFQDEKSGVNAWDNASATGIFTETDCPNNTCTQVYGGHEVLAVNFLSGTDKDHSTTELIFKNSWGLSGGLDVDGNKTDDKYKRGYYRITTGYLKDTTSDLVNDAWDFILPKTIASSFKGLKIEKDD